MLNKLLDIVGHSSSVLVVINDLGERRRNFSSAELPRLRRDAFSSPLKPASSSESYWKT